MVTLLVIILILLVCNLVGVILIGTVLVRLYDLMINFVAVLTTIPPRGRRMGPDVGLQDIPEQGHPDQVPYNRVQEAAERVQVALAELNVRPPQ
jgi:hypothetical protein